MGRKITKKKMEALHRVFRCYMHLLTKGQMIPLRDLVRFHNNGDLYFSEKKGRITNVVVKV